VRTKNLDGEIEVGCFCCCMIWAASEADQAARGLSIRGETLWALEKGLVSRCHRLFLIGLKPTPINSSSTQLLSRSYQMRGPSMVTANEGRPVVECCVD
jgi:hypothetical protein